MEETIRYANIAMELCTIAFCFAGIVNIGSFSQAPRKQRLALGACFFACALMAASDSLSLLFLGKPGPTSWAVVYWGCVVTFSACCALVAAFTFYLQQRINEPPPPLLQRGRELHSF